MQLRARFIGFILTAFSLTAFSQIAAVQAQSIPSAISQESESTTVKIYAPYLDSNKNLKTETGTGVIVSQSGEILTAYHVVEGWTKLSPEDQKLHPMSVTIGSKFATLLPISIVVPDTNGDLALLRILAPGKYSSAPLCFLSNFPKGEALYAFAFPNENDLTPLTGIFGTSLAPDGRWTAVAPFDFGASGAPAYNTAGVVIGLIRGGSSVTSNQITPILWAKGLLENRGVSIRASCDLTESAKREKLDGTFTGVLRGKDKDGPKRVSFSIKLIDNASRHLGTRLFEGAVRSQVALLGTIDGRTVTGKLVPADWVKYTGGIPLEKIDQNFCKNLKSRQSNMIDGYWYQTPYRPSVPINGYSQASIVCTDMWTPDNVTASLISSDQVQWKQDDGDLHLEGSLFRE